VIQGDQADVESYVLAYHRVFDSDETVHDVLGAVYAARHAGGSNEGHDFLAGGQWFDRFERRDGVWRIINRVATTHWDMVQPSSSVGREGMFKAVRSMGPPDRGRPLLSSADAN
jgi:hypothetical protein